MAEQDWKRDLVDRRDELQQELMELLAMPSVSTDPERREVVRQTAEWVEFSAAVSRILLPAT